MTGYSESALERKLSELNNSAQSIQQLSLWLIHHRKHYHSMVKLWFKEFGKTATNKKLTFLYLANDVVQNSKKKHPEIVKEFGSVMVKVIQHFSHKELDPKTVKAVSRLLSIWQDRSIFDLKIQTELSKIWTNKSLESATTTANTDHDEPVAKKPKTPQKTTTEQIKEILSSSPTQSADPPEPEELIKAIQDLENAASSDAAVREKISRLPPEVSEPSHLDKIESVEEGQRLLVKVSFSINNLSLIQYGTRFSNLRDQKFENWVLASSAIPVESKHRNGHTSTVNIVFFRSEIFREIATETKISRSAHVSRTVTFFD